MSEPLDPSGGPVQVGRLTLYTPGLAGVATWLSPQGSGTRAAVQESEVLERALQQTDMETIDVVEIAGTQEIDIAGASTRSTAFNEPAMVVEVPDPGPDWGQVILYADEDGVMTWELPVTFDGSLDTKRGGATRTYLLRRRVPPARENGQRGLLGTIAKKILKVIVFKLVDRVGGLVGDYFAAKWEAKRRSYRIRTFAPDNYGADVAAPVDWVKLSSGRALLALHGTFSRTHSAFERMPQPLVVALQERYGDRTFAFDHFTMSEDPIQNANWFLSQVPDGTQLDVDIICHSRGGLLARTLAELQAKLPMGSRRLRVNTIVFVASPNAGTPLTDPDHMGDFIDTYTNLLQLLPDNGATEILECAITVLKQLAVGALRGLEGLQCMHPTGPFLKELNRAPKPPEARYLAISADFEPQGGLGLYAGDRLMDAIFEHAKNDLVVPTESTYGANGSAMFPITDRLELPASAGIFHTGFFGRPEVEGKLRAWLLAR